MKALSIQQPWAWLIAHGYKDIENRDWSTRFRGRFLIHAGKKIDDCFDWSLFDRLGVVAPASFERGGIVGVATLVNVVTSSNNRWFRGVYGFVLKDACSLPFTPLRGQLYFFDVDDFLTHENSQLSK